MITKYDEILPVGSIVTLNIMKEEHKDAKFVILKRFVTDKTGQSYYYEYEMMPYPAGSKDGKSILLNHEQVKDIIFRGYSDELEEKFKKEAKKLVLTKKLRKKQVKRKEENE